MSGDLHEGALHVPVMELQFVPTANLLVWLDLFMWSNDVTASPYLAAFVV